MIAASFSPQLGFLAKYHIISLLLVHEVCHGEGSNVVVEHIESGRQCGGFLTKNLDHAKLEAARLLVGLQPARIANG